MSFLFKNYSLVKVIYLLISCYKTRFFMWNANNIDRNGVNKQNTHENENFSIKISDTTPFFKTTPPILATPPIFMGKIWTPPPPFFWKILKTQPPFIKGQVVEGWGFQLCFTFFKLRKNIHWLKNFCYTFFIRSR